MTLIDCDLIIDDDFFEKIIKRIDLHYEPCVIQGFEKMIHKDINPKRVYGLQYSSIYNFKNNIPRLGQTGFILSFNRPFLELIDFTFPEIFILGSFDYFLYLCLTKRKKKIMSLTTNEFMITEMMSFYEKVVSSNCDYLSHHKIEHEYHGPLKNRGYISRWPIYDVLDFKNLDFSLINEYFKIRNI